MGRDVLASFNDATIVALCLRGQDWPRALLTATPIPDAWMGLVWTVEGLRRFVPAGESPRAEAEDRVLLVRNRALTVALTIADAPASCGNVVNVGGEVLLRWPAREDELSACLRAFMSESALTLARLQERFEAAGARAALQRFVRGAAAADLCGSDQRDSLANALRVALSSWLFETGLTIDRVASLQIGSESLERRRRLEQQAAARVAEVQAREMVEQAANAAAQRRVEGLSAILEKLRAASAGGDATQWRSLLPALSPAERGRLLENLWRITPDQRISRAIVCVGGQECLWLDPRSPLAIAQRVTLPGDLGPLRSITSPSSDRLLIGAATGVWLLDAASGAVLASFPVPDVGSASTGFNSAAVVANHVVATHSELGCWAWRLDSPADRRPLLRPANGVPKRIRAATTLDDGGLAFAADDVVHLLDAELNPRTTLAPADSAIHAIATADQQIVVGTAAGRVLSVRFDAPDQSWFVLYRRSAPIESVCLRCWNDLKEVVVPAGQDGAIGVYGEEGVLARLMASAYPLRKLWAADDLLLGRSELRDRLAVLHADAPDAAPRDVPLARLTGKPIEDAGIVTARAKSE
ncbi:MAG: hypothetical protein U1D55_04135 [Phycisphaerae bacterium]